MRKPALLGQTSDMSNIRKTKKCCKPAKTSFTRANIRYVKHPKNQKLLQTSKKQLFQGNNLISQTSEKPKKAANMQKPALPGQTSDISMIRKTKKCCNYPKTSFTMANIRNAKHPKNQKVLQTSEKQLPGQTSDMSNIRKNKKCCKHPKSSFFMANIRYVKHSKNQKVLETSEKQTFQGKPPICQTSEKQKSAAIMRKPALLGQTSDMSNIRKTKKCCKPAKTSFTRANIRYVKHPKNQKLLQTSKKQLFQGNNLISQTSEKPKKAANMQKPALPGQTSEMPNIRKTKKCCKHPKSSFQGKHPICQTSEKTKSAANIRKAAFSWQTSDVSNI